MSFPAQAATGVLELRGLRFFGCHGLLPEERERCQPFEVDLDVHADFGVACRDDDIRGTVDYSGLCEAVRRVVHGPRVGLLERLAELIAAEVAAAAPVATEVGVVVRKLRPPVPYELATVGVRVRRRVGTPDGA
ncbi:MAG TPA: dihydroneopterin aldolase [Acidimicrobiales bacterium]|nr:dihydroneopterin aldolase [Acidimicrobiales bacterium]